MNEPTTKRPPSAEGPAVPTTPAEFYKTGGTMARDAASYVVRQADTDIWDALRRGEYCYVLTSRQMGKSSLMVRTAGKLREAGAVAVLDLTAFGQNLTPEQWYDALRDRLGQQLRLEDEMEDYWEEAGDAAPLQKWFACITEVALPQLKVPLVIFIDEIDFAKSLPFSTDEFFSAIRECYNRRVEDPKLKWLTFCLLGVASPSDLIRDTRTTPFNIGRRIELTDFTPREAAPLTKGLRHHPSIALLLLERVLHWTGGHPYLTQRLCRAVAEDGAVTEAAVDRLCDQLFLSTRARASDDNLMFVRERALRSEVDHTELLRLYDKVRERKPVADDAADPLINVLRLAGLTRAVDGQLKVRNRIYGHVFDHEWVEANLPEKEVQRQRVAYRQGLLHGALAAAVVLAVPLVLLLVLYLRHR